MTPTLFGRIQTRLFLLATVGVVWTIIITPLVAVVNGGSPLGATYKATFLALLLVAVLGTVLWEPIWHLLMLFRWDKDWPALFILLESIPEGILVYFLLTGPFGQGVSAAAFLLDFGTVWLAVFFAAHGPMRVPFLRWRFRGGRIV